MVALIPNFLPMKRIKIEISSFDSDKWIYIPKSNSIDMDVLMDVEGDPFPLTKYKFAALHRTFFGYKSYVQMDKRIVRNGLEILERRQQLVLEGQQKKLQIAYQDQVQQKLDKILNQMQGPSQNCPN
jgi:hypothetical protein